MIAVDCAAEIHHLHAAYRFSPLEVTFYVASHEIAICIVVSGKWYAVAHRRHDDIRLSLK